jgi:plasmid maintenance system antidote protein VapI
MMTGEELVELGQAMYQAKGWKSRLATDMGVYVSTVNRWINGQTPISKKNELALRALYSKLAQPKRQKEMLIVRDLAVD